MDAVLRDIAAGEVEPPILIRWQNRAVTLQAYDVVRRLSLFRAKRPKGPDPMEQRVWMGNIMPSMDQVSTSVRSSDLFCPARHLVHLRDTR